MNTYERLLEIEDCWDRVQRYLRYEDDPDKLARAMDRLTVRIENAILMAECTESEKRVA